jgi:pimeloyl-ACP methyl ester carboxylesterase
VADYRLDQLSNDVAALIRSLGHDRAFVVAHDWGGIVAWHLASAHPELVEKLAVLNCPHPSVFMNRLARLDLEQLRRSTYMLFFQVPWLPERMFPPARLARVIRRTTIHRGVLTKEDVEVFERELSYPGTVHAALNYYRAIARDLMWPWRRKTLTDVWKRGVQAPTLIIWGEQDPFLGIRLLDGHEALARTSLVVRRIPDVGHWVQQEAATEVNQALLSFFAPSPSQSGRGLG